MAQSRSRKILCLAAMCSLCFPISKSWAQDDRYQTQAVTLIVPWGEGGGADQLARETSKRLKDETKMHLAVVNLPGASGSRGVAQLLNSPADGHTLAVLTADTSVPLAYLNKASWSLADVTPIAVVMQQQSALLVRSDGEFKTWAEFEKAAKARPNGLKVAISGLGTPDDLTLDYLASLGIKVTRLPYSNPAERYASLMSGAADVLYEQPGDVRDFVDRKQMRPIILFGAVRSPDFKDVPSSKELGLDVSLTQYRAIVVKAGTDPQHIAELKTALAEFAASPEYKAYLKSHCADEKSWLAGDDAAKFIADQLAAARKIVATLYWPDRFLNQATEKVETYVEPF